MVYKVSIATFTLPFVYPTSTTSSVLCNPFLPLAQRHFHMGNFHSKSIR